MWLVLNKTKGGKRVPGLKREKTMKLMALRMLKS